MPTIVPVMRWISLTLIFNALSIIPKTILIKDIDFKKQTLISFTSALISGIIGIVSAFLGIGVWALVAQQISLSVCMFVMYIFVVRWTPLFVYDRNVFKELFNFNSGDNLVLFGDIKRGIAIAKYDDYADFVNDAKDAYNDKDVKTLRKFITKNGGNMQIISKIESQFGVNNLDEIIENITPIRLYFCAIFHYNGHCNWERRR